MVVIRAADDEMRVVEPHVGWIIEIVKGLITREEIGQMAHMETTTMGARTVRWFPWKRNE